MKVKVSEWLSQYIVDNGILYNFTVPGRRRYGIEYGIWASRRIE